jgi:pyrroline-5-carboxylate reductase
LKLGFIGTGAIAEAVITGMLNLQAFDGGVVVSSRSQTRSQRLAKRFQQIVVESDNQNIVDLADWIFISVLPSQAVDVISSLKFRPEQIVVSMIAGRTIDSLATLVAPAGNVFRIIPMPPIELGMGPIVITPPSKELGVLFEKLGTPIQIDNEEQFLVFSASSAIMASFFELVASQARWIEAQGIPRNEANRYASSLIRGLSEMSSNVSADRVQGLAQECQTVGGLNEQVLNESKEEDWFGQMDRRLDRIAQRLDAAKKGNAV